MKITTLIENESGSHEGLYVEHGISLYIEADGKKILFDTGASGNFIDNAKSLGIKLEDLDYVIISHGHYDHSGGFKRLIEEINPNIKLFIGSEFFNKKYSLRPNGEYDSTGSPFNEEFLKEKNLSFDYIDGDVTKITENIMIFTKFNRNSEFENINETMYINTGDGYEKDMFRDEISLGIKTDKGLIVIVGCSHAGIVNILDSIDNTTQTDIYAVVGGTHLIKEDDEKINKIIDYLKEKEIKVIGACHCTGKQGETMLSQQLEDNFITNNTGDILEF